MSPVNLLLAKLITDAGEVAKFCGIWPSKLLLLSRIASRFLLNTESGMGPEKRLNLRSKYKRFGICKVMVGKDPENWLLLRSSSVRAKRSFKLSGIVPENLLLLR
ncbi:hypothetical protein R6Q59_032747 [Mikania micrantha]